MPPKGRRTSTSVAGTPRKPVAPFFLFMREFSKQYRAEHSDEKFNIGELRKACSAAWKEISGLERERYQRQHEEEMMLYEVQSRKIQEDRRRSASQLKSLPIFDEDDEDEEEEMDNGDHGEKNGESYASPVQNRRVSSTRSNEEDTTEGPSSGPEYVPGAVSRSTKKKKTTTQTPKASRISNRKSTNKSKVIRKTSELEEGEIRSGSDGIGDEMAARHEVVFRESELFSQLEAMRKEMSHFVRVCKNFIGNADLDRICQVAGIAHGVTTGSNTDEGVRPLDFLLDTKDISLAHPDQSLIASPEAAAGMSLLRFLVKLYIHEADFPMNELTTPLPTAQELQRASDAPLAHYGKELKKISRLINKHIKSLQAGEDENSLESRMKSVMSGSLRSALTKVDECRAHLKTCKEVFKLAASYYSLETSALDGYDFGEFFNIWTQFYEDFTATLKQEQREQHEKMHELMTACVERLEILKASNNDIKSESRESSSESENRSNSHENVHKDEDISLMVKDRERIPSLDRTRDPSQDTRREDDEEGESSREDHSDCPSQSEEEEEDGNIFL